MRKLLTLTFRVEDSIYGKIYIPINELAKDLTFAGERRTLSEDGMVYLRKWFDIISEPAPAPLSYPANAYKNILQESRIGA